MREGYYIKIRINNKIRFFTYIISIKSIILLI